nr:MAG TPA: hypothetical protein [Microviridae sp.]
MFFWFEWRFSALPCGAYAELGLIHSFLALCAFMPFYYITCCSRSSRLC